jgi:NAD(P)H-hydrate epimerase
MPLLTRDEVRELDRMAIEEFGLPGLVLMENAGRNAAAAILQTVGPLAAERLVVVVGPGNNGGDGLVIARHLELAGVPIHVVLAAAADRFRGDAATNLRVVERSGIQLTCLAGQSASVWQEVLGSATCVIDALLGTGAVGPARGDVAMAISSIVAWADRAPDHRVIAIDLPSGLDCDTGRPLGPCVRATRTLTFVAAKLGFAAAGADQFTGPVEELDIGAPRAVLARFGLLGGLARSAE